MEVRAQQNDPESDFWIDWDTNKVEYGVIITGYRGSKKEVRIPPRIQSYPVTEIGESAFAGCESLTEVTIPNSVTIIWDGAFECCTSLTKVKIPDSVTIIGNRAFADCTSLTKVKIPDSVISIENSAFAHCTSLTSVTFQGTFNSDNVDGYTIDYSDCGYIEGLHEEYIEDDGGPGTYKRFAGGYTWRKLK